MSLSRCPLFALAMDVAAKPIAALSVPEGPRLLHSLAQVEGEESEDHERHDRFARTSAQAGLPCGGRADVRRRSCDISRAAGERTASMDDHQPDRADGADIAEQPGLHSSWATARRQGGCSSNGR